MATRRSFDPDACSSCWPLCVSGGPGRRSGRRPSTRACRHFPVRRARCWGSAPGVGGRLVRQLAGHRAESWAAAGRSHPRAFPPRSRRRGRARDRPTCKCRSSAPQPQPVSPTYDAVSTGRSKSRRHEERRTARWPDARSGHRHHARAEPRPPLQVLRDPDGAGRHPPGQPAIQPRLLSGRSAPAVSRRSTSSAGAARRPAAVRHQHHLPARRLAQAAGPDGGGRPAPSGSWRRSTRMPSASGSTTSTVPTSRPWRRVKRFATPSQSVEGLEQLTDANEQLHEKGQISQGDLNLVKNKLRTARLGSRDAEAAVPQGQARSGIAHEPHARRDRGDSSCAGRSAIVAPPPPPARRAAEDRPGRPARRRLVPARRLSGPRPTSGWPGPTLTATSTSSGSPIRSRTTPPTA